MKSSQQQKPLSRGTSVLWGVGVSAQSGAHVTKSRGSALEPSPGHQGSQPVLQDESVYASQALPIF